MNSLDGICDVSYITLSCENLLKQTISVQDFFLWGGWVMFIFYLFEILLIITGSNGWFENIVFILMCSQEYLF